MKSYPKKPQEASPSSPNVAASSSDDERVRSRNENSANLQSSSSEACVAPSSSKKPPSPFATTAWPDDEDERLGNEDDTARGGSNGMREVSGAEERKSGEDGTTTRTRRTHHQPDEGEEELGAVGPSGSAALHGVGAFVQPDTGTRSRALVPPTTSNVVNRHDTAVPVSTAASAPAPVNSVAAAAQPVSPVPPISLFAPTTEFHKDIPTELLSHRPFLTDFYEDAHKASTTPLRQKEAPTAAAGWPTPPDLGKENTTPPPPSLLTLLSTGTTIGTTSPATKPGAVRVRGLNGGGSEDLSPSDEDDIDLEDDNNIAESNEEPVVPELPAELVAGGVTQDNRELQQLRERLANVVKAQAVTKLENDDPGDAPLEQLQQKQQVASVDQTSRGKCAMKKGVLVLLVLGISAIAVGVPLLLRENSGDPSRTSAATSIAPTPFVGTASPMDMPSTMRPPVMPTTFGQKTMMPTQVIATPNFTPPPTPEECVLEVTMPCNVTISNLETGTVETTSCLEAMESGSGDWCYSTPFKATFLYNGGGCKISEVDHACRDTQIGPPPAEKGAQAYIIVTDSPARGYNQHVYFRGFVSVGDFFPILSPGETLLDTGIRILIFRSDDIGDQANLLQEVQYHGVLCSDYQELTNHFGASQLSSYENDNQGHVPSSLSTVVNVTMSVKVHHLPMGTGVVEMINLTASSNLFPGRSSVNFTDQVVGSLVQPGESISVTAPLYELSVEDLQPWNLKYWEADASGSIEDSGSREASGRACTGEVSYYLGGSDSASDGSEPSEDSEPSASPTQYDGPCQASAAITCEYGELSGGRILGDCKNAIDPRLLACRGDLPATGLAFRYLRGTGLPDTVFIDASSSIGGSDKLFSSPVNAGDIFQFEGNFRGEVIITISLLGPGGSAGQEVDRIVLNTACREDDLPVLILTTIFGPLELVGFENLLGYFSSMLEVHLQYFVENVGLNSMVVESARIISEFIPATLEAIASGLVIDQGLNLLVYEETNVVDFGAKFAQNDTYAFALTARGHNENISPDCFGRTRYSF